MVLDGEVLPETTSSRQIQFKDDDGLTLQQRGLLQELVLHPGDWRTACDNAEVKPSLCQSWLAKNDDFRDAYNLLIGPTIDIVTEQMKGLAHKAADMFDESVEAVRMVKLDVSCPECKHEFSVGDPRPDWSVRQRAGDMIMRTSGVYVDRKQIQQTNITLNVEQSMALMSYRWSTENGLPITISPSLISELRKLGEINDPAPTEVVDAEHRGIQSGDGDPSRPIQSW